MQQNPSIPAGWHPDPQDPAGSVRWWDGLQWTEHVRSSAPVAPPAGAYQTAPPTGAAGQWQQADQMHPWAIQPAVTGGSGWWKANPRTWTAVIATVIYALLDIGTGLRILGILPVMAAIRACSQREKLAPLAVVAAAIAVLLGLNVIHLHG